MRTFSESLARLAELLPKIDVECRTEDGGFEFDTGEVGVTEHDADAPMFWWIGTNWPSRENACQLEFLSDLVHERTGWYAEAQSLVYTGLEFRAFAETLNTSDISDERYKRRDQAHVEALILAIEKHLEEK